MVLPVFGMAETKELKSAQAEGQIVALVNPRDRNETFVINTQKMSIDTVETAHPSEIVDTVPLDHKPVAMKFGKDHWGNDVLLVTEDTGNEVAFSISTMGLQRYPMDQVVKQN